MKIKKKSIQDLSHGTMDHPDQNAADKESLFGESLVTIYQYLFDGSIKFILTKDLYIKSFFYLYFIYMDI
ncbi:MAG: hypothetical protein Q8906_16805 [Bacillota bacterium]|nr:hypothetical protein [Bacillota bacterium]